MATLDDIATWCTTTKLKRTDITDEARECAKDFYLVLCERVPLEGLETKSPELPVQAGVDSYDLTTGPTALTPALTGIMSIRYKAGAGRQWRLRRSDTRVYDSVAFSTGQDPRTYARFGNAIELMPTPQASGPTFRVRYWATPTLASPNFYTTVVAGTPAWQELMRYETLYRLYIVLEQHDKATQLVMPMPMPRQPQPKRTLMFEMGIIPRLWNDLLSTIRQRENVDEDFSINPVYRSYTHVS